jgi:hypothetical protein
LDRADRDAQQGGSFLGADKGLVGGQDFLSARLGSGHSLLPYSNDFLTIEMVRFSGVDDQMPLTLFHDILVVLASAGCEKCPW